MNILLLGAGGRENALAHLIRKSPTCNALFIAPGNGGSSAYGQVHPISTTDFDTLWELVEKENIHMIIIGPEAPLVEGAYDFFKSKNNQLIVVGPSKAAAQLEGSKSFAKSFMMRHHIPTAAYREFDYQNLQEGFAHIEKQKTPIVLKADGLAAGKGVLICTDKKQAQHELSQMIKHAKFGKASEKVVIEEFLDGIEFSVFVLTDGQNYKILPSAKDYKRIGEGDKGLNTGGMGCVSPAPFLDDPLMKKVEQQIIQPTIKGLYQEKLTYKGFIYFGLIRVGDMPKVIEYNCRFGDPEAEVILPKIQSDILEVFKSLDSPEGLKGTSIQVDDRPSATVMLVSGGYPEKYEKNKRIQGVDQVKESFVFQAGTLEKKGEIYSNGGRVLAITSIADTLEQALAKSYRSIKKIHFENMYFRKDIGHEFI